jgi:hypothetical protein
MSERRGNSTSSQQVRDQLPLGLPEEQAKQARPSHSVRAHIEFDRRKVADGGCSKNHDCDACPV